MCSQSGGQGVKQILSYVSAAADSRVAALTVQADVMIVASYSGAVTLVELVEIGGRDFLYSGGVGVDLPSRTYKGEWGQLSGK